MHTFNYYRFNHSCHINVQYNPELAFDIFNEINPGHATPGFKHVLDQ